MISCVNIASLVFILLSEVAAETVAGEVCVVFLVILVSHS